MFKKSLSTLFAVSLLMNSVAPAFAHSGRTDSSGCHTNRRSGEYHCHGSSSSSKSARTQARTSARGQSEPRTVCSYDAYNCADFSSHADAQNTYEFCLSQVGSDIHRLDGDNDGSACEALN